jgi:hypothetical protein
LLDEEQGAGDSRDPKAADGEIGAMRVQTDRNSRPRNVGGRDRSCREEQQRENDQRQ